MEATFATVSAFVGILVSLILAYVPPIEKWYTPLESKRKVLINVGLVVVSCIVVFLLSCYRPEITEELGVVFPCTTNAIVEVTKMVVFALMANQTNYMLAVKKFR